MLTSDSSCRLNAGGSDACGPQGDGPVQIGASPAVATTLQAARCPWPFARVPEAALFQSRFTGHLCVAVFDRAIGKLRGHERHSLTHADFLQALDDYDILRQRHRSDRCLKSQANQRPARGIGRIGTREAVSRIVPEERHWSATGIRGLLIRFPEDVGIECEVTSARFEAIAVRLTARGVRRQCAGAFRHTRLAAHPTSAARLIIGWQGAKRGHVFPAEQFDERGQLLKGLDVSAHHARRFRRLRSSMTAMRRGNGLRRPNTARSSRRSRAACPARKQGTWAALVEAAAKGNRQGDFA